MKLPKELTPELLCLVLDEEVTDISRDEKHLNRNEISYTQLKDEYSITNCKVNIDTLTRLMIEWCVKQYENEYMFVKVIKVGKLIKYQCYLNFKIAEKEQISSSEFEAVLKATEWVVKQKEIK